MAGYKNYSMSNNAIAAYSDGEKPLSKWTKSDILGEIKKAGLDLQCNSELLAKLPVKELKHVALVRSSWHHTSSHYNRTDFYSLNLNRIEEITDSEIQEIVSNTKEVQKPAEPQPEKWKCAFLEWTGSRKHPKAVEVIETGEIKGDWFMRSDGTKKSTTARGFRFIEKI